MTQNQSNFSKDDDLVKFKAMIKRPSNAWPTLMLLLSAYLIFGVSSFAYIKGLLPFVWAVLFNAIASYMAFTVTHDATHNAVSSNQIMNDWAGRAGITLLEPGPFFSMFRYIHMQHHKFTNDPVKDPDAYSGAGPVWLLPLRWLSLDLIYFRIYLNKENFLKRPRAEQVEFFVSALFALTVIILVSMFGWLEHYLLLFIIPTRISKLFIVFAFDFLPHYPHNISAKENRYRSTSNRVGCEWLLTPLFIYQNYHLVHHLYPAVPFYRYIKIWNARKAYHLSKNPAITDALSLNPRKQ